MATTVSERAFDLSIERPALYVVATPIGNLGDITCRAVATLKAVDIILAEDTRLSRRLLEHFSITTPTESLHEHNERRVAAALAARIKTRGLACALISDAGTPLVSDPGYVLVREAISNAIPVHPVPGACAAIAALSSSGLAADRFVFEGFLPPRRAARLTRLRTLADEARTLVLYESPHRIEDTLTDLGEALGHTRDVVVFRELTKIHETRYRGTVREVAEALAADPHATRGELVIVIAGAEAPDADVANARRILSVLLTRMSSREAIELAGALTGMARNALYALALALKAERD